MAKIKGDGKAGGGLAARIKGWENLEGQKIPAGPRSYRCADGNGKTGATYHKPGSQNARKGGRGRAQ